jgi:hypothetical protein
MTETIIGQLDRIADAKADIKTSIGNKGVAVPSTALLDAYSSYVDAITPLTMGYTAENALYVNYADDAYECTVTSTAIKGYHDSLLSKIIHPDDLNLTALTSSEMSVSGKTITVPVGYYSSSEVSKSVADGSYSLSGSVTSTPTATLKQTAGISLSDTETSYYITVGKNGSTGGSVTHSASITSGYIASGTSPASNTATIVNANVTPETFYIPAATTAISTTSSTDPYSEVTPSESVQYLNFSAGYTPVATMKVNAISSKYVGSGVVKEAATIYNTSTTDQIIAAGVYLTGAQTFRGVTTSGISAENIKKGVNVNVGDSADDNRIAGVTGTFTSSSTVSDGQTAASAAQIRSGYSAWVDGTEVKGSLANGTITNNTTLPSGSTSSGTITDGSYIKIGAGYYSADKYYYAQNWAYKTNTPATIDVNDLTITPNALVGTWDNTNSKYVISQASKSTNSQSTVTTAGYISSTVGTKNTGVVTVSAPSNLELPASTWAVDTDGATSYTTLERGTTYKMTGGYYPYVRYYHTQPNPTLSGNASAANVLKGATFYNNSYTLQTGTMTNNDAVTATISTQGGTYTIPAGYHNGSGKVTASITAGSATTPATTVPVTISGPTLNAKGIYMISVSGSKSITPSVTAGYISSGTAGTVSVSDSTSIATSTFASATLPSGQTATATDYDTVYKISAGYNSDRYIQAPSYSTPYNAGYTAGVASVTMETLGYTAETALSGSLSGTTYTVSTPQTKGYHSSQLTASVTPETLGLTARTSLSRMRNATKYTMTVSTLGTQGYYTSNISTDVSASDLGYTQNTAITITDMSDADNNTYYANVKLPNVHGYNSSDLSTDITPENLGLTELTSSDITYSSPYTIVIGQGTYADADTNFNLTAADITVSGTATSSPVVTPTMSSNNVNASTSTSSSYYIVVSGATTTTGSVTPKMTVDVPGVVDDAGEYTGAAIATSANVGSKTIYIPASGSSTSTTASGTTYDTITPSTSVQYRNFTAGYTPAGNFKIEAMPTMTLPTSYSTSATGTTKATITATGIHYINIPTGYNSTAANYKIQPSVIIGYTRQTYPYKPDMTSTATIYYFKPSSTAIVTGYYPLGYFATSSTTYPIKFARYQGYNISTTAVWVGYASINATYSGTSHNCAIYAIFYNNRLYLCTNSTSAYIYASAGQQGNYSTYPAIMLFGDIVIGLASTSYTPTFTSMSTYVGSISGAYSQVIGQMHSYYNAAYKYIPMPYTSWTNSGASYMYRLGYLTYYATSSALKMQCTWTQLSTTYSIGS